jgi:hypothetical protein
MGLSTIAWLNIKPSATTPELAVSRSRISRHGEFWIPEVFEVSGDHSSM